MSNAEQTLQESILEAADEIAPGSIPALRLDERASARLGGGNFLHARRSSRLLTPLAGTRQQPVPQIQAPASGGRRPAAAVAALAVLAVVGGLILVAHQTMPRPATEQPRCTCCVCPATVTRRESPSSPSTCPGPRRL